MNSIIDISTTETAVTEPVTLTELKTWAKVDHADDDTLLTALITTARKAIENYCGVSLVTKEIVLTADWDSEDYLPYGPIQAINTVQVRTGTTTAGVPEYEDLTGDEYTTDGVGFLLFDSSLTGRHKITYDAGYTDVPEPLQAAIKAQATYLYENRGDSGSVCDLAKVLANPYKTTFGI